MSKVDDLVLDPAYTHQPIEPAYDPVVVFVPPTQAESDDSENEDEPMGTVSDNDAKDAEDPASTQVQTTEPPNVTSVVENDGKVENDGQGNSLVIPQKQVASVAQGLDPSTLEMLKTANGAYMESEI